ncbi:MAG TPA: hypothetical protein G4O03_08030 [Dehalococcoidia bacterium]|nr:hypothetical protein [Dehalococcoidia bacterium]
MEFRSFRETARLLTPPHFRPESQEVEYREDPLTGWTCIINIRRARRVKQVEEVSFDLSDYIQESRRNCPFCPGNLKQGTPKFPSAISETGRLERGQALVFPNLFPFAKHHAIATFDDRHYLDLDEFGQEMIRDNLLVCGQWLRAVYREDREARYPIYLWNHMPPAAASIVHPHVQVLARGRPTRGQSLVLQRGREYYEEHGTNYWADLIREERRLGHRFIYEDEPVAVVASFAPRGFREVQIIFKDISSFLEMGGGGVDAFAFCIRQVLGCYRRMGVGSFNLITFSGPIGEKLAYYCFHARIISRPSPRGLYSSDTGPMERLQDEPVIETLPEDVAGQMRRWWGKF